MSITEKIVIRENKVLKLSNVLIREISGNELIDIERISYMMDSYIKSKGNGTIGPMINYSGMEIDECGQAFMKIKIMVQLKNPIHNIETPYKFKSILRVSNCLFARFNEKEENIQFAYQKLGVYAFENDIKLKGDSYTIFVNQEGDKLIADVFMETLKGCDLLESV